MASKSGYVRLTYIFVRTFAYGPLRTYVRLFAYVRIRPSCLRRGAFSTSIRTDELGGTSCALGRTDVLAQANLPQVQSTSPTMGK